MRERVEILEDRALLSLGGFDASAAIADALATTAAKSNTILVTTLADKVDPNDSVTSLREAIPQASSGDVVLFDSKLDGGTITLSAAQGGQIKITKSLTISTAGLSSLTLNGNGSSRIFHINSGSINVKLIGLTFTKGTADDFGGAIYSNGASLTVSRRAFIGNSGKSGGGVYISGGSCKFEQTSFVGKNNAAQGGAAFVINCSSALFDDCQFTENVARASGNKLGAGLYLSGGNVVLRNCTIAGNQAGSKGGGIYNDGSRLTLLNTILAENSGSLGSEDYYQVQSQAIATAYSSLSSYQWSLGADNYVYNKQAISIFTNASNGDYSLSVRSFAVNAGDNSYVEANYDLVGGLRIVGESVDLGAREYGGAVAALSTPRVVAISTSDSLELSWKAVSGATGYVVAYRTDDGACYTLETTTKTNFVLANLPLGAAYSLTARAINSSGERAASAFSDVVALETRLEATTLPSPKIVSASASETSITITWNAVSGATKYRLAYALNDVAIFNEVVLSGDATSYTIRDLEPNTIYLVKAMAEGDGETTKSSPYGDSLMISTLIDSSLTTLSTPEILSVSSTKTSFTVRWSPVANASKYQISYAYSGSVSFATDTVSSLKTTFTKSGLANGRTFKIVVRALGDGVEYASSANSEIVYVTTSGGAPETNSLVVTTLSDVTANDGLTSLREAIASATDGDTITFSPQLNNGVIELNRQLVADKSITIDASACGSLTLKGAGDSRVISITGTGNNVSLLGLTITGGSADLGGGVYVSNATVSLMNCVVTGNKATEYGGGIYVASGRGACQLRDNGERVGGAGRRRLPIVRQISG